MFVVLNFYQVITNYSISEV